MAQEDALPPPYDPKLFPPDFVRGHVDNIAASFGDLALGILALMAIPAFFIGGSAPEPGASIAITVWIFGAALAILAARILRTLQNILHHTKAQATTLHALTQELNRLQAIEAYTGHTARALQRPTQ